MRCALDAVTENSAIFARTALTGTLQDLDVFVQLVVMDGTRENGLAKPGRWTVPGLCSRSTILHYKHRHSGMDITSLICFDGRYLHGGT